MAEQRKGVSKKLGQLLLEKKIINQKQLDKALSIQKEKGGLLGQILVLLGYATEEQIAQALTVQYGYPYLPLASYEVDREVVKLVPENVSNQYCLIPIDKMENTLTITIGNPLNKQAIEDIEDITHCDIQIFVSTMSDINRAIKKYYKK